MTIAVDLGRKATKQTNKKNRRSGVGSVVSEASQIPGGYPTEVDYAPTPAHA